MVSVLSPSVLRLFLSALALMTVSVVTANEPEFYDPIEREIEGWTIALDPKLLVDENREDGEAALKALANHLQRIQYILPNDKVRELQKLRIWVDWNHPLSNMQYHPSRGWLVSNGYDPRLAKHVHIPRARQLLNRSQWAKHPYVVLHELAHSYHDQVLGFDEPDFIRQFEAVKAAGIYESVLSFSGGRVKHYGLTNHKEYFAESTEAYLGVNDFFPFVRAELKHHDPKMHELMERTWGKLR